MSSSEQSGPSNPFRRPATSRRFFSLNVLIVSWLVTCVLINLAARIIESTAWLSWEWEETVLTVWGGCVAAQLGVHAIWTVFGPWRLSRRLLFSIGSGLALVLAYSCPEAISESRFAYRYYQAYYLQWWIELLRFLLCLPLMSLAIQLPLWAARAWLGGGFVPSQGALPGIGRRSLSIRDLLVCTAVVATVLAAARLGARDTGFRASYTPAEDLVPLVIGSGVYSALSLVSVLPTLVSTHLRRWASLAVAATIVLEAVAFLALIGIGVLIGGPIPPSEYISVAIVFVSFVAFLTTPLMISRWLGYRLVPHRPGGARVAVDRLTESDTMTGR